MELQQLIKQFESINSSDDVKDNITDIANGIHLGLVINVDDPLEGNRLQIYCPTLNDNPKKIHHIPWAIYLSPFGGSINNGAYTRGHLKGQETTSGAVHYGMWGAPEQGAHVAVGCFNGDIRRRFYIGSAQEHQETHTILTGRYDWSGGFPDGPLSSTKSPIEPQYTNMGDAFQGDRESAEWKTRGADYQPSAVNEDVGEFPNPSKSSYLDNQYTQISENESDDWVKGKVGAHGYDWSGYKSLGAFKASRAYGMSTPGFHSFMMDDRPFNSRIKLRTTAGHQFLMDDTNERITLSTYGGKAYVEMDVSGNIDVYTDRRLSFHAKKDINFETDETFRVKAKKGIHMYSGDTVGQTPLTSIPEDGQIRFHSTHDMHFYSEENIRTYVVKDYLLEVGENVEQLVAGDMTTESGGIFSVDATEQVAMKSSTSQMTMDGSGIESEATQMNHQADTDITLSTLTSVMNINPATIDLQGASNVLFNNLAGISSSFTGFVDQYTDIMSKFNTSMLELNATQLAFTAAIDVLGGGTIPVPSLSGIVGSVTGAITGMITLPDLSLPDLIPEIIPELNIPAEEAEAKIAIWPNRTPEHEPWARVLKQDSDDTVNEQNNGYLNNVDSIDQYDNVTSPKGREPIGVVEGDEEIDRNQFWRR